MKNKNSVEIIITVALAVLLAGILFGRTRRVQDKKQPAESFSMARSSAAAGSEIAYDLLEKDSSGFELRRDPFSALPFYSDKELPHGMHLSGIVFDKDKYTAIINDEVVEKGSRLDENVSVVDIQNDKVILDDGGAAIELTLE